MKPRPRAVHHLGTCLQCNGDVLTIPGNPVDLRLCGDCLVFLIGDAAGTRSAIRKRWAMHTRRTASEQDRWRVKLECEARANRERVV